VKPKLKTRLRMALIVYACMIIGTLLGHYLLKSTSNNLHITILMIVGTTLGFITFVIVTIIKKITIKS
jgi:hypothetical protein